MKKDLKKSKAQNEVFFIDEDNELGELEKLMEKEIQTREKPKELVKPTKLRASIPMIFEVFAFTTPKIQEEGVCESEELSSSDDEDDKQGKDVNVSRMEIDNKD